MGLWHAEECRDVRTGDDVFGNRADRAPAEPAGTQSAPRPPSLITTFRPTAASARGRAKLTLTTDPARFGLVRQEHVCLRQRRAQPLIAPPAGRIVVGVQRGAQPATADGGKQPGQAGTQRLRQQEIAAHMQVPSRRTRASRCRATSAPPAPDPAPSVSCPCSSPL
jgi:hypothetical protein